MRKIGIVVILALLMFVQPNFAQTDSVIRKIIKIGQTDNQTMQHLNVLCNRFGGRPIGSDAYENAAIWAAYKFEQWGMEVEFDEVGALPVGFNRGPWFGRMLGYENMILHFATPSYTSGTLGKQRGHVVIEPYTNEQFNRIKGKLKGAWVLVSGKSVGWPIDHSKKSQAYRDSIKQVNANIEKKNQEIRSYNWKHRKSGEKKALIPYVEEPGLFYKEMKAAGILGLIQSAPVPITALYDRKNLYDLKFDSLPTIPDIKLDEHQYDKIKQLVEERRDFELEFDIRNHFKMGPVKYHSVIGIIRGTDYPDEYVIMGGHLDSYDVATGGVDDGSGVTLVMEAARLIMAAGGKPKRTILVCLWAGEEFGLLGSQHWVDNNPDKLQKISNMFNRDGGPLVPTGIAVTDSMRADVEKICEPLNDINPEFPFQITTRKARTQPEHPWGTDSGPFAVAGVPTMEFTIGDVHGHDFDYHEIWHTDRDLYNKSIPEYQEHAAIVTAVVVYGVANLTHRLNSQGYYTKPKEDKQKKKY